MDPNQNQEPEDAMTAAPRPSVIDLDSPDLTMHRMALISMIKALQNGPKSRERSIVVTKLEEAFLWAGQALVTDPVSPTG